MDRIADLPESQYKNKEVFPKLPRTDLTFMILSFAFHLHKAKTLLKRLSRMAFNMVACADQKSSLFDTFKKKLVNIPISSNENLVICGYEFEKFYMVRDSVPFLNPSH